MNVRAQRGEVKIALIDVVHKHFIVNQRAHGKALADAPPVDHFHNKSFLVLEVQRELGALRYVPLFQLFLCDFFELFVVWKLKGHLTLDAL